MTRLQNWAPCPFCQSRHLGIATRIGEGLAVQCRDCRATGPAATGADDAIAAWEARGKGKRPAPAADVAALRTAALERGQAGHNRIAHGCQVYKVKKGPRALNRGGGRCDGKVVAAVAFRSGLGDQPPGFVFVCGTHRHHHGIAPAAVVTVVELPDHLTAPLRQEYEREQAAARKLRDDREAAGLCANCGRDTDPAALSTSYCGWHDVPRRAARG